MSTAPRTDEARSHEIPEPLTWDAREVGVVLSVSLPTIRRMDAAGQLPRPIRIGRGSVRWRRAEIRDWLDAGCPDRATWDAMRSTTNETARRGRAGRS